MLKLKELISTLCCQKYCTGTFDSDEISLMQGQDLSDDRFINCLVDSQAAGKSIGATCNVGLKQVMIEQQLLLDEMKYIEKFTNKAIASGNIPHLPSMQPPPAVNSYIEYLQILITRIKLSSFESEENKIASPGHNFGWLYSEQGANTRRSQRPQNHPEILPHSDDDLWEYYAYGSVTYSDEYNSDHMISERFINDYTLEVHVDADDLMLDTVSRLRPQGTVKDTSRLTTTHSPAPLFEVWQYSTLIYLMQLFGKLFCLY